MPDGLRKAACREGDDMIAVPAGVRVLVATKPIDFRRGGDGLAALIREVLGHDRSNVRKILNTTFLRA